MMDMEALEMILKMVIFGLYGWFWAQLLYESETKILGVIYGVLGFFGLFVSYNFIEELIK